MSFAIDPSYNDVAGRIAEFKAKYPDGGLQQVSLQFIEFAGGYWVVYTAAALRGPDDPCPGHGTAWEPVPGRTPYTKDSEVQNAETAAWGRAIVAALAADTKKGVASADEIRNRQADRQAPPPTLDELLLDAEQANTGTALDRVARRAVVANLSAEELAQVRAIVTARRAELTPIGGAA